MSPRRMPRESSAISRVDESRVCVLHAEDVPLRRSFAPLEDGDDHSYSGAISPSLQDRARR